MLRVTSNMLKNVNGMAASATRQARHMSAISGNEGGYMMTGRRLMRSPKILVTGAVGQVGQELVPYLRNIHGSECDSLGCQVSSQDLYEAGPFQYIDVLEANQMTRLIVEENVQCIVHLAAVLSATGEKHPIWLCASIMRGPRISLN